MNDSPQADSQPRPGSRRARRAEQGDTGFRLNAWPFIAAAAIVILVTVGLLWWFLGREEEEPAADWEWIEEPVDGVHARGVPPEDWEAGWCLTGYEDEDTAADVVDCEQSYDRQVLLRQEFDNEEFDDGYPGEAVVLDTAHQWCNEAELSAEALAEAEFELQIELWHPTDSTWNREDDRMVSCFVARTDQGQMSGDFLPDDADDATPAEDAEMEETDVAENGETEEPDSDGDDGEAD